MIPKLDEIHATVIVQTKVKTLQLLLENPLTTFLKNNLASSKEIKLVWDI